MVRMAALVSALILATPASAQSTDCIWIRGGLRCTTPQSGFPPVQGVDGRVLMDAMRAGQADRAAADNARREALMDQQRRDREASIAANVAEGLALQKDVTAKLAAGQCNDAIAAALLGGDILLAAQAKQFCATPGPTP